MRRGNDSATNSPPHNENGMHAPPRQVVVRGDGDDEENGDAEERLRPGCIQHPDAGERSRKQRDRGEQYQSPVRVGATAQAASALNAASISA